MLGCFSPVAALPLLVLHRAEVHLHVRVTRLEALLVLRLRRAHAVAPLGGLDGLVNLVRVRVRGGGQGQGWGHGQDQD